MERFGFDATFVRLKEPRVLNWKDICREVGFEPDVVVYSDRSFPPPLLEVERYPCLTCFYAVDSHIHDWYPVYAKVFDCCAASLKDHVPAFDAIRPKGTTIWLPPYPRENDVPQKADFVRDVCFVGNVNPETTPKRVTFLKELDALLPGVVHVDKGAYQQLFASSRIVLNIAERGDLNFRVFEALACGACLLTPKVAHGQAELFEPGQFFETYENLNAEDAASQIKALLADPDRCAVMRKAGQEEIERAHRMTFRAQQLADLLRSEATLNHHAARLADPKRAPRELRLIYLHWAESLQDAIMRARYIEAAKSIP